MPVHRSCLIKAMVFPVVMCGCESWTIEKAECRRIDAFELWCWTRLLRVSSTVRRSNQSILKEISPEYSAEGLMLKLKLQYFGHLMQRTDSLEKTLMLGRIEGGRRRGRQDEMVDGITNLDGPEFEQASGGGDGQEGLVCYSPWDQKESDTTEQLNWAELIFLCYRPQSLWCSEKGMRWDLNSAWGGKTQQWSESLLLQVIFPGFISDLIFRAEKAMLPHSSTLAWKIPWTEEPGGLQSSGSLRVGHDWATSLSFFTFMHWRRKWQPTPVSLPGESQGRGNLVGCRLWVAQSDTTEVT